MRRLGFISLLLITIVLTGCQTINQQDRAVLRAHNVPEDVYDKMLYGDPLTLGDVIVLSQRRVPPGLIIHYMQEVDMVYGLAKADVERLRSAGVDEQVIAYMLSTAPAYGPPYRAAAYPYPPPYPYPYAPYPYYYGYPYGGGPVVVVGGGGGRWGWRHW